MTSTPIETLIKLADEYCIKIEQLKDARLLRFEKSSILVEVTVPEDVLEWFINATDENGQSSVEWWCDYEGYDDTPREDLMGLMSNDIDTIAHGLLMRKIRITARPKSFLSKLFLQTTRYNLEWLNDGNWAVALE